MDRPKFRQLAQLAAVFCTLTTPLYLLIFLLKVIDLKVDGYYNAHYIAWAGAFPLAVLGVAAMVLVANLRD